MPEQLTPENVLNLFVKSLGKESKSIAADVSTAVSALLTAESSGSEADSQKLYNHLKEYFQPSEETKEESVEPLRHAFRRSAAVLTAFNPSRLKPFGMSAEPEQGLRELVEDLTEVYDPPTPQQCWMLRPEIRSEVLKEMGSQELLLAALNTTPEKERPHTLFQHTLEAYIRQDAPPPLLGELSLQELMAHLQAVRWLQPSGLILPSPEEIQEIIDYNQVPAVFEKMAGQNFVGREKELGMLRDYVEVLPPSTGLVSIRRQVRRWLGLQTKPPLVIYSSGGTGKTTLISKFLLEHMNVPDELKFPYVYLDFDNPRLSLNDPNTILDEAVRQLSAQYPNARQELKDFIAGEQTRSITEQSDSDSETILDVSQAAQQASVAESAVRFAMLVNSIVHRSSREGAYALPLLIVLDTYEEVQSRGFSHEIKLWNLLDSIQKDFQTLRTVVFGRAPLEEVPTSGISTTLVQLGEFDREVAHIFLKKLGVEDAAVRQNLYDELGGNPLSLKLVADIYRREGYRPGIVSKSGLGSFFFSASEGLVQGQLYQRILGHIHDPDVKKIAHPGLMLRRITPELIKEVLQKPCDISVPDMERAQQLFEALGREVSLVTRDIDGALRHRPDVRRTMLNLLARDKPEQTEQINRLAVAYYGKQVGVAARAEEIYHRLQLGENANEVGSRWEQGVEEYLRGAVEELPVESRVTLASFLGIRLKKADVEASSLAEWERYTASTANRLVTLGHYDEAMKLLRERSKRTPGSPLYFIEAKALVMQRLYKEASKVVDKALSAAATSGNRRELMEALLLAAKVTLKFGGTKQAEDYLVRAGAIGATLGDSVRQIVALLVRMRLPMPSGKKPAPSSSSADLRPEMARLLDALPDADWISNKRLVRASVSLLGLDYPAFVLRMLKYVGLGKLDKAQVRIIAVLIEKLQKDAEVKQLTVDFAKTMKLPRSVLSNFEELTHRFKESERLDEYFQKLLPILLKQPDLLNQASYALRRLYQRQKPDEQEATT